MREIIHKIGDQTYILVDVTPTPPDGFCLGEEATFDYEAGTFYLNLVKAKSAEDMFEQTYTITEISRRQGDIMLETYHLYDTVQSIIPTLTKIEQIEAMSATSYRIDNQLLVTITGLAGITPTQLRVMFYEASYF